MVRSNGFRYHKRLLKRLALSLLTFAVLFSALLYLSPHLRHKVNRIGTKAEMKLSKWRGVEPRLASIAGESGIPGARVQALDSRSGWATLCDREGKFILPDVLWYSGASYDLVVSTDERNGKRVEISAPTTPPEGVFNAGKIALHRGGEVDLQDLSGINSVSYEDYDFPNRDYYRRLFEELTQGKMTDEERIKAVNDYIAGKLNYKETQWELGSPRRILERGSQYCGHLASAMAAILAVAYPTRIINLSDGTNPPNTHVVVEVFYQGRWHLYDPTFGVEFKDRDGKVAGYQDVRLDTSLISRDLFESYRRRYPKASLDWMPFVYASGFHRFYAWRFKCEQFSHAWFDYLNGLDYVPSGGRILLAAAGIRPGTAVTYHIKRPGISVDEMAFTTRRKSNSACVLNEEESPPINLPPGTYEVYVDFEDGNALRSDYGIPVAITNWRLRIKLDVR